MWKHSHEPARGILKVCRISLLWIALGFVFYGCVDQGGELLPEKEERAFRRGVSLRNEGRNAEALLQFYDVIRKREVAPESHLEAGLLYLNALNEPSSAIYHFNRYLSYHPDGPEAERVKQLVNTALKEVVRSIPPFDNEVERLDVYTKLQSLEEENVQLRQQLAATRHDLAAWQEHSSQLQDALEQARARLAGTPTQVAPIVVEQRPYAQASPTPQNSGPRTYTVQPGDTLSRISREVYGTTGRWTEIFEANRDQLPSQNSLRPGQVLQIP